MFAIVYTISSSVLSFNRDDACLVVVLVVYSHNYFLMIWLSLNVSYTIAITDKKTIDTDNTTVTA